MYTKDNIWIGKSEKTDCCIIPKMANRHGLIAGATGTGKTVTLKVMAESLSDCGVPVFLADAKGDLAAFYKPGENSETMQKRVEKLGIEDFQYQGYPTCFWDVFGEKGHPLRTTISEMGPELLARLLDLNTTQSDVLSMVFRIADDQQLLLLDLKDLRAMMKHVAEHAAEYTAEYTADYGNITKQSAGAVSRALLALEDQGGSQFFGEPALDIHDWFRNDDKGKGFINVLDCTKLINSPKLYSSFMLWMMSELFEILPEAGDAEKPKMVFFFDEAHMLFDDASKTLLQKIEQMVKLIRSKGVGIYFITQSPSDIPGGVLSQLGNRVQHALRAYTPEEQKGLKAAAGSFRENPEFKTIDVLQDLGIGEALTSFLDEEGRPSVVARCTILPPQSCMGAISDDERHAQIKADNLMVKYDETLDRDSAYEFLSRKPQKETAEKPAHKKATHTENPKEKKAPAKKSSNAFEKAAGSALTSMGREVGRTLIRGLFKNLKF